MKTVKGVRSGCFAEVAAVNRRPSVFLIARCAKLPRMANKERLLSIKVTHASLQNSSRAYISRNGRGNCYPLLVSDRRYWSLKSLMSLGCSVVNVANIFQRRGESAPRPAFSLDSRAINWMCKIQLRVFLATLNTFTGPHLSRSNSRTPPTNLEFA